MNADHQHKAKQMRQFNEFREIAAKFASMGTCGHRIEAGDMIGFSPKRGRFSHAETQCSQCWQAWQSSVAADNFDAA